MSCKVYYRFKDNITEEDINFEGPSILAKDLLQVIRLKNGLKLCDCNLLLTSLEGKEYNENDVILSSSSVIVLISNDKREYQFNLNTPKRKPSGPVPDNYVCNKCRSNGHWISDCPGIVDKQGNVLNFRNVKRATGIPIANLIEVDSSTPNSYLTNDGRYVVKKLNHSKRFETGQSTLTVKSPPPVVMAVKEAPVGLLCDICWEVIEEPTPSSCGQKTYCESCASHHNIMDETSFKQTYAEEDDLTDEIFGFSSNKTNKLMLINKNHVYAEGSQRHGKEDVSVPVAGGDELLLMHHQQQQHIPVLSVWRPDNGVESTISSIEPPFPFPLNTFASYVNPTQVVTTNHSYWSPSRSRSRSRPRSRPKSRPHRRAKSRSRSRSRHHRNQHLDRRDSHSRHSSRSKRDRR